NGREARTRFPTVSDLFVTHQLGLVDIRVAFEQHVTLTRWLTDKDLAGLSLGVVPDAYLEYDLDRLTFCAFVEYDRWTETLAPVERKVRAYLAVAQSGRFERTFGRTFFRTLMIADSCGRLEMLSNATR